MMLENLEVLECIEKSTKQPRVAVIQDKAVGIFDYDKTEPFNNDPKFIDQYESMDAFLQDYNPSEGKLDVRRLMRKMFHNESSFQEYMKGQQNATR